MQKRLDTRTVLGEYRQDFIRISYANSYENLEIAMERMKSDSGGALT
jgi:hypothetical protein